jgi:hypothetical protein
MQAWMQHLISTKTKRIIQGSVTIWCNIVNYIVIYFIL